MPNTNGKRSAWGCAALCAALIVAAPVGALAAPAETLLYRFTGGGDGYGPYAGLIFDSSGNLYGTTWSGGLYIHGTVFKLSPGGTETVLHSFGSSPGDGAHPFATLISDSSGNLYGTTRDGGAYGYGTVFKLSPSGTEAVLHSFKGGSSDGATPYAGLIFDSSGNLYGTTTGGGSAGGGTVFKLTPSGTETVLHSFGGKPSDGAVPYAPLIADSSGNLYGTTYGGGGTGPCSVTGQPPGCGTVFKVTPSGAETVLYRFTGGADGQFPEAGLIFDSSGNLYGATNNTVFKLTPGGAETVLSHINGGITARLILDSDGNLFGTTNIGGAYGHGSVFKLAPDGTQTTLYSFCSQPSCSDGAVPAFAALIADSGNLYGTTEEGGTNNGGTVFKLTGSGFVTTCTSRDAALTNKQFPVAGEMTYDISSPTRILQSISLIHSTNIASSTLPTINSGGHSATGGKLFKSNPNETATFEFETTFVTPAFFCTLDPTTVTVEIEKGYLAIIRLQMVPGSEHFIGIDNGDPGLNWLRIDANGEYFGSLNLSSGKTVVIDASAAMNRAENTLVFTGEGRTGSYANIDLSDSAPSGGTKKVRGAGRVKFRF